MTLSKGLLAVSLMVLSGLSCTSDAPMQRETPFRAMSFNIRYDNPNDGPHRWDLRKEWVAEIISESQPDLVGLQEALVHQIDTLAGMLPAYNWVGQGRDDGRRAGEFSPILYRIDRLHLLTTGTFWLSPHPDSVGSVGWDADLTRIVTWAAFEDRRSGQQLFHFNTHFDHVGETARLESAKLIRARIREIAGQQAFVLTGDFNATESSQPYLEIVRQTGSPEDVVDSRLTADIERDPTTYRGFVVGDPETRIIDYVFFSRHFQVTAHEVIDESREGAYPSDHLPVLATARLSHIHPDGK